MPSGGHLPTFCALMVKNMANGPAKNMSSLDSQMMVPTLTMLGLFSVCMRWLIECAPAVTRRIMSCDNAPRPIGSTARRVMLRIAFPATLCRQVTPGGRAQMDTQPRRILVFSHRPEIRETIITAVGRRPAADIGKVTYVE